MHPLSGLAACAVELALDTHAQAIAYAASSVWWVLLVWRVAECASEVVVEAVRGREIDESCSPLLAAVESSVRPGVRTDSSPGSVS